MLFANPQAIRSANIKLALDNARPTFIEEWVEELSDNSDTLAPREQLEAQIAYYAQEYANTIDQLKRICVEDTTGIFGIDSLKSILINEFVPYCDYELASVYLQEGNFDQYRSVLSAMPVKYNFNDAQLPTYHNYVDYFQILETLITNNMDYTVVSSAQKAKLYELINCDNFVAAYARTILYMVDTTFTYNEPIYIPDEPLRISKPFKKHLKAKENILLNVYPNPAQDYFIVEFDITDKLSQAVIEINDITGHKIQDVLLNTNKGQKLINTKQFAKGIYICCLKNNGKNIGQSKVVIK